VADGVWVGLQVQHCVWLALNTIEIGGRFTQMGKFDNKITQLCKSNKNYKGPFLVEVDIYEIN